MPTPADILRVAIQVAKETPRFWDLGANVTTQYLNNLEIALNKQWAGTFEREQVFDDTMPRCAFDFYCRGNCMAIEIALSSHGSNTEYFKDVWKALLAARPESDAPVKQLLIIGKHPTGEDGFVDRHGEGLPQAIVEYCNNLGLTIHFGEIPQPQ